MISYSHNEHDSHIDSRPAAQQWLKLIASMPVAERQLYKSNARIKILAAHEDDTSDAAHDLEALEALIAGE